MKGALDLEDITLAVIILTLLCVSSLPEKEIPVECFLWEGKFQGFMGENAPSALPDSTFVL